MYYECPMLCTLTLSGLERATRALTLKDYNVVAFSFDPRETAVKRRVAGWVVRIEQGRVTATGRPEHILTEGLR